MILSLGSMLTLAAFRPAAALAAGAGEAASGARAATREARLAVLWR